MRNTSLNRTMLGWPDSMRWLMISRSTFLSICGSGNQCGMAATVEHVAQLKHNAHLHPFMLHIGQQLAS